MGTRARGGVCEAVLQSSGSELVALAAPNPRSPMARRPTLSAWHPPMQHTWCGRSEKLTTEYTCFQKLFMNWIYRHAPRNLFRFSRQDVQDFNLQATGSLKYMWCWPTEALARFCLAQSLCLALTDARGMSKGLPTSGVPTRQRAVPRVGASACPFRALAFEG